MSSDLYEKIQYLWQILKRLYERFWEEDVLSKSAQVAFYLSFSLFPLLLFLVNLFGLILDTADDLRLQLFSYLKQIMPPTAYSLVQRTIEEVTANSSGSKLTFGFVVALWSASAGMDSLRVALNHVFRIRETRTWWRTKAESLLFTLLLIVLLSFVLGIVFYGWKFLSVFLALISLPVESFLILQIIQWLSFVGVLLFTFGILYRFLPNHDDVVHRWVSIGSVAAIILWVLVTNGFRVYLNFFDNYDKTYGSLGAMIVLLLWLYLTALVILIGALVDSVLAELKKVESPEVPDQVAQAAGVDENI